MKSPEKEEKSLEEPEKLLELRVPEVADVKAYAVRLKDGRIVIRTEEELKKPEEKKGGK